MHRFFKDDDIRKLRRYRNICDDVLCEYDYVLRIDHELYEDDEGEEDDVKKLSLARKYLHDIVNSHSNACPKSVSEVRALINKASTLDSLIRGIEKFHNTYELKKAPKKKKPTRTNKKVADEDVKKYDRLVEMYMKKYVQKNWNEASMGKSSGDISLGNSGLSMNDIRQYLRSEIVIAVRNYDPNYRTKSNKSVKESTFVYTHLFNRIGQLMKKLTRKQSGYGVWVNNLEEVLWETDRDA